MVPYFGWVAMKINNDESSNNSIGSQCDLPSMLSAVGIYKAHSVCYHFCSQINFMPLSSRVYRCRYQGSERMSTMFKVTKLLVVGLGSKLLLISLPDLEGIKVPTGPFHIPNHMLAPPPQPGYCYWTTE